MRQLTAAAAVVAAAAVLAGQARAVAGLTPQGTMALTDFLRGAVSRGDVPAVVALVVNREQVLYHEAFGSLNAARALPLPRDAIFNIASMTKPLTSTAIVMLAEEGKLGFDDEVAKYLPAYASPKVIARVNEEDGSFETRPARRPITIRQLLTHTSGIGYAWSDPQLYALQTKRKVADADLPLVTDPGERWMYGASTRVLGDVVGKVSGQRIDAFLQARILGPLGMRDTGYSVPADKAARVVTTHDRSAGTLVERPNPASFPGTVRGDGGLYSTAADYGQFVRMMLNRGQAGGTRLLGEASVRAMTTNQIGALVVERQPAANAGLSKPYPLGAGRDTWGLGFQLAAAGANGGRSAGSYSWAGLFNTHFWVDPQKDVGVIVLMQLLPFYDDRAMQLLAGVEQRVYQHLR